MSGIKIIPPHMGKGLVALIALVIVVLAGTERISFTATDANGESSAVLAALDKRVADVAGFHAVVNFWAWNKAHEPGDTWDDAYETIMSVRFTHDVDLRNWSMRTESRGTVPFIDTENRGPVQYNERHYVDVCNAGRQENLNLTQNRGAVSNQVDMHMARAVLPVAAFWFNGKPWAEVLRQKDASYAGLQEREGEEISTFTFPKGPSLITAGFLKDCGYALRYLEWRSRSHVFELDLRPVLTQEGFWVPMSSEYKKYRIDEQGKSHLIGITQSHVIHWRAEEKFEKGAFAIAFPSRCVVEDEITEEEYLIP